MTKYRDKRCSEEIEMRLTEMDNMSQMRYRIVMLITILEITIVEIYNKLSYKRDECDDDDQY